MDPGACGAPSGAHGLGGLESSLPHSDPPCLIVEDSQPDSLGIEDDPENSYRALLSKRLSGLQPRGPSPVLELISSPVGGRSSQSQSQPPVTEMNPSFEESEILDVSDKRSRSETDSRGESQALTHEEGASQFGFLELSQSQDFGAGLDQDQSRSRPDESSGSLGSRVSPKAQSRPGPPSKPGPQVSVDVLLHSQNQDQDQELLSSQEDLFAKTGAAPEPVLPSCTPSRSLALLHLSGGVQGTLVNNSLSQGSVDFVAPTPDNFTPMIVPSSPTELPHGEEPMDTSLPPTGQSERREPGPASSTPVSQNTPGFEPERPLSVPSQPDFSHDVFAPTQSQDGSRCSQSLRPPSAATAFSQSSLNLCINTEPQHDDDDEATQIEDQTSQQQPATNSQNALIDGGRVGSQNSLRTSSQGVKTRPETAKHGANSDRSSQECLLTNVRANSQPAGSVTAAVAGSQAKTLNVDHEKLSQRSVDANSQPAGSVTKAGAGSQTKTLNVNHEKNCKNLSQGSAKANSQPAGSVTDMIGNKEAVLSASQSKRTSEGSIKANSQPSVSVAEVKTGSQTKHMNVDHEKNCRNLSQGSAKANSQPAGSIPEALVGSQANTLNVDHGRMSQSGANANSQPAGSDAIKEHRAESQAKILNVEHEKSSQASSKANSQPAESVVEVLRVSQSEEAGQEASARLVLSQSEASTPGNRGGGAKMATDGRGEASGAKSLDSSGDISFHFTLPKEGELIGPSVGATPPQIGQLKQSVRHSTPIEVRSPSQSSDAFPGSGVMAVGGDTMTAEGAEGKLSLRMKLVTPVDEGGSERFSLQRPSLTEDDSGSSKPAAKSTNGAPSVFSRVRQVHRREQDDSALRSPLFSSPQRNSECNSLPNSQSDASLDAASLPHTSAANESRGKEPSHQAPGAANSHDKTDSETPPTRRTGPAHRRHIRTIQEVRTTVTRIITDVYYEDGKEVDRTVTQETDEPVVQFQTMDVSPSRTGSSSVTSGDLADISSSTCTTGTTSSSAHGPASSDRPDFLAPPSRGAKTSRRAGAGGGGRRRGAGSASVSPRGKARRGRPPSRSSPHSRAPPAGPLQDSASQGPVSDSAGTQSGSGSSFVGLRVVAKWSSNGYFYSGRIIEDHGVQSPAHSGPTHSGSGSSPGSGPGENRFRLRFDDGYECELWARDILLCDPIPLETEVTALNQDQTYTMGVVKAHRMEGSELQYCVERGEQRLWFSRSSVILSLDQGNRLREHHSLGPYQPPTTLGKASDISLDNLVEGKRKRRGGPSSLNTPTRSPRVRSKPSPGLSSDQSPGPGPGPGSKRKLSSDRSPAAKRGRRGAAQQVSVLNTSDSDPPPALCDTSCDLSATHGPRPQNSTLFEGFVFLLTASSERDRLSNLHHDDQEELVQTGPYNKAYTETQLQSGGGIVLKEFNHQQCQAAYQSLLVADQHCRNRTYLLCVVGGVPCVSHLWVRDCCRDNSLHNYRNYLLPAGAGPEGGVREWRPRCSPFQSLRVLLLVEDQVQFWSELVRLGGGTVLVRSPSDLSEFPADSADVVVSDSGPVPGLDLPRVSVDWLVDSVVCGERLDLDSSSLSSSS